MQWIYSSDVQAAMSSERQADACEDAQKWSISGRANGALIIVQKLK